MSMLGQPAQKLGRPLAERARNQDEVDDADLTLASLIVRYEGLRPSECRRQLSLGKPFGLADLNKQIPQPHVEPFPLVPRHCPAVGAEHCYSKLS